MARKTRIEFEGALYHVIVRGNQKRKVFKSGDDYRIYLEILQRYKSRYQFALYAYVLMTNHIHLFAYSGDGDHQFRSIVRGAGGAGVRLNTCILILSSDNLLYGQKDQHRV